MTAPALAHDTPLGRMYSRSLSERPSVPSITTVIGVEGMDLGGWHGYMAAQALAKDSRLPQAVGNPSGLRQLVRDASGASEKYRDSAAARGDRVHYYCEQVSLEALGREHEKAAALDALASNGEVGYAHAFDRWWQDFGVKPLEPELTVWNSEFGYAGTLDLIAEIGGKLCIVDYKTKGSDRDGRVKPLDPKVALQLVAGLRAEERLDDAQSGSWSEFPFGKAPMLIGVALGENEVQASAVNSEVWRTAWQKFWSLRQVWAANYELAGKTAPLTPLPPPPASARQGSAAPAAERSAP